MSLTIIAVRKLRMRSVRKNISDRILKIIQDNGKASVKNVITTGKAYIFIINNNNINTFQCNLKSKSDEVYMITHDNERSSREEASPTIWSCHANISVLVGCKNNSFPKK